MRWVTVLILAMLSGCATNQGATDYSKSWSEQEARLYGAKRKRHGHLYRCPRQSRLMCSNAHDERSCSCVELRRSGELLKAAGF